MLKVVFDIETDGLLAQLTTMHSLVIRDADTGELLLSCTDDPRGLERGYRPIREGLSLLSEADLIYGHNIQGFDIPAIKKLHPEWTYRGRVVDTVLVCGFRFAHIRELDFANRGKWKLPSQLIGKHKLEAWGYRLGLQKGEYSTWCKEQGLDPWSEWRPEMQSYCELDTEVNYAIVQYLRKKKGTPALALEIEHKLAKYLRQQEENGWPFDVDKAYELAATLSSRREELAEQLREQFGWWYSPNGTVEPKRSMKRTNPETGCKEQVTEGCPYTKLKVVEFNPGSRDHIALCLKRHYRWKPKAFTNSGKPQVDEKTLKGLKADIAPVLLEFLMVEKRLGQISNGKKAWLKLMTGEKPQGGKLTGAIHLHHWMNQNGCVTHRGTHNDPNLGQVPKVGKPHGAECRELYTVPNAERLPERWSWDDPEEPGKLLVESDEEWLKRVIALDTDPKRPLWVQLGADASGLELRCLAHHMAKYDKGRYVDVVLHGDIHTENRLALGLPEVMPPGALFSKGRDVVKTWIYAYLYGAGDEKLGSIIAPGAKKAEKRRLGAQSRKRFEKQLAAAGKVQEQVKARLAKGYLRMPDKRRTYIRHAHAALNSQLQGDGAIICKLWIIRFADKLEARFGPQGWNGKWAALGWIHDEVQLAVRPEIALEAGQILVETIREVGEELGWRCPLDGEAKLGRNWRDCH